jgi:hypothetical protein
MQSFKNMTKVHKQKVKNKTIVNSCTSSRFDDPFRYKINCKNLIHLPRWQLPCNASSLRIDHYNILIYHELGAHSNAPCSDTWYFHLFPPFFSLQPSIQNTLHVTNKNAQYKWWWNHITMCINKEWSEDESCNNGGEWNDKKINATPCWWRSHFLAFSFHF